MRTLAILLGTAAALALGPACSKSRSPSVGGETNWLVRCSSDEPCESGSCLCGVCTRECNTDSACSGDFAGSCTGTDEGAGELLCATHQSTTPEALCLPRCSSTNACGTRYACEEGVCVPRIGGTPPVGGAGSGGSGGSVSTPPPDGGPDACVPTFDSGACSPPPAIRPLLDQLTLSRAVWQSLATEQGDTYWYEEQNCAINVAGGGGEATLVQVEDGVVALTGTHDIPACVAVVNRYGGLSPARTMDELYELCWDLVLERDFEVRLRTDPRGVIQTCFVPDEPGCQDACGSGFALSAWAFGRQDNLDAGAP